MILLIDNYDSFVYNLQRYLVRLGQQVAVIRNDDPSLAVALADGRLPEHSSAIVISPGPKRPQQAGHCLKLVERFSGQIPMLGVCLGHQIICEALGGQIVRALQPVHGTSCTMHLSPSRLFSGLGATAQFARYHSLIAEEKSLPTSLRIIARAADQQIMAVEHREHPTFGIQFHPESVLSISGYQLLHNFLHVAGLGPQQVDSDTLPSSDLI